MVEVMGTLASLAAANTERGGLRSQNVSTGAGVAAIVAKLSEEAEPRAAGRVWRSVTKAATLLRQQSWNVLGDRINESGFVNISTRLCGLCCPRKA